MKRCLVYLTVLVLLPTFCFAIDKIDINSASSAQLDELTGIGPVYAQRIIDGRPYSSVDDLLKVNGIGPATLQKIKDQGLACVNCSGQDLQQINTLPASLLDSTTSNIQTYPDGIYINEVLPNPEGPDETDEWLELYNSNNFDVDLSNWKIQDTEGTVSTYIFPLGSKILANSFLTYKRPATKIMLNNDKDGLNLIFPNEKIAASLNFVSAPLGQSYNKTSGLWQWSKNPTPGDKNIITKDSTNNIQPSLSNLEKSDNSIKVEGSNVSQILDQDKKINNPWFLFFITIFIIIILSLLILFIKFRLNKYVRT